MSEAPERIWAGTAYGRTCGVDWSTAKAFQQDVEYHRADLPPTLSAAMELPEIRALVARLRKARLYMDDGCLTDIGDEAATAMTALRAERDAAVALADAAETRVINIAAGLFSGGYDHNKAIIRAALSTDAKGE